MTWKAFTATALLYGLVFAGVLWLFEGGGAVHLLLRSLLYGVGMATFQAVVRQRLAQPTN